MNGRREIGLAAVAITLCDVVVFAPIAFMTDLVGQFFKEFGLTVVFATLLSLLVSFTVTPMMASRMLISGRELKKLKAQAGQVEEGPQGRFGRFFQDTVIGGYRRFLQWSLDHRAAVIVPVVVLFVASIALIPLKAIETEFMPTADQTSSSSTSTSARAQASQTDAKARVVEQHLLTIPEVEDAFVTIGSDTTVSTSEIIVKLKDKGQRRKGQTQLARELRAWGREIAGSGLLGDGTGRGVTHVHRRGEASHHERHGAQQGRSQRHCRRGGSGGTRRPRRRGRGQPIRRSNRGERHREQARRGDLRADLVRPGPGAPHRARGNERRSLPSRRVTSTTWSYVTRRTR